MKRTPIKDRVLPNYTRGEETANMITHIVGGGAGIAVLTMGIIISALNKSGISLASSIVYGFSMIALYSVSSVYHGLRHPTGKRVMQVIDHCTIYFLILGTYLPIILAGIMPVSPLAAWLLLAGQTALASLGVTFTAIDHNKYKVLSMSCYIVMGWLVALAPDIALSAIGKTGFMWLLGGGIVYTVGAILYAIGRKRRFFHTVFHVFTVLAGCMQAVCVLFYVL